MILSFLCHSSYPYLAPLAGIAACARVNLARKRIFEPFFAVSPQSSKRAASKHPTLEAIDLHLGSGFLGKRFTLAEVAKGGN
jgi:hypothetical protein